MKSGKILRNHTPVIPSWKSLSTDGSSLVGVLSPVLVDAASLSSELTEPHMLSLIPEVCEFLDAMADMMDFLDVERERRDNLANPFGDSTCGLRRVFRLVCETTKII